MWESAMAKGGRGKKCGISEAVRRVVEMPHATAQPQYTPKPAHTTIAVSKPQAPPTPAPRTDTVTPAAAPAPRFSNAITVTLSSLGTSRPVNLDWTNGAPVGVAVTGSSSGTFVYSVQYTLDDLMLTPAANVVWISDPNATALTSNSSGIFTYTAPLAGIRINSSTAPSWAVLTMKVTQGSWL
jgi:hypothetical protein